MIEKATVRRKRNRHMLICSEQQDKIDHLNQKRAQTWELL